MQSVDWGVILKSISQQGTHWGTETGVFHIYGSKELEWANNLPANFNIINNP